MNNPVRTAEELAMIDQLSGGRLVALFLRGTPNEFLVYGVNPAETRARTQEPASLSSALLPNPNHSVGKVDIFASALLLYGQELFSNRRRFSTPATVSNRRLSLPRSISDWESPFTHRISLRK
jgi:Luciferase-like monooxygenase